MRERKKGIDLGGWGGEEQLGGVEEGEPMIRICCTKKKNPFSRKKIIFLKSTAYPCRGFGFGSQPHMVAHSFVLTAVPRDLMLSSGPCELTVYLHV